MDSDRYRVATGFSNGRILVWSAADDNEMQLEGHLVSVLATKFSQESKLLLSGSVDGAIKLWDCRTGQQLRTLSTSNLSLIFYITFSRNGKFAADVRLDGSGYVWNLDSGTEYQLSDANRSFFPSHAPSLTEKGDVISGSSDGTLFICGAVAPRSQCAISHRKDNIMH